MSNAACQDDELVLSGEWEQLGGKNFKWIKDII